MERGFAPSCSLVMFDDLDRLHAHLSRVLGIARSFLDELPARPVAAAEGAVRSSSLMADGEGLELTLDRFEREILPRISASAGPRYLGFVTGGANPAALVADWLVSLMDQNVSVPGDSIAPLVMSEALGMLLDLFELPRERFTGTFTTGATASNLLSIAVAREHVADTVGLVGAEVGNAALPPIKVFSACPHASYLKVMGIAGLGRSALVPVARLPGSEAMDPADLERALGSAGEVGAIVVASAATVTGTSFDDLERVADIAERHGAWLHVDGAFGLFARTSPRLAHLCKGVERASSITGDGHKWLNVPYDCGFFFTSRADLLERAFAVDAPYLQTASQAPVALARGIENSQRFRALPVWFTLEAYGRSGVRQVVERCCDAAGRLGDWLGSAPGFELMTPVGLNVVVFRGRFDAEPEVQDRLNVELLHRINATGKVFCTPGAWQGRRAIRASFSSWMTRDHDVDIIIEALVRARDAIPLA